MFGFGENVACSSGVVAPSTDGKPVNSPHGRPLRCCPRGSGCGREQGRGGSLGFENPRLHVPVCRWWCGKVFGYICRYLVWAAAETGAAVVLLASIWSVWWCPFFLLAFLFGFWNVLCSLFRLGVGVGVGVDGLFLPKRRQYCCRVHNFRKIDTCRITHIKLHGIFYLKLVLAAVMLFFWVQECPLRLDTIRCSSIIYGAICSQCDAIFFSVRARPRGCGGEDAAAPGHVASRL